MAIQICSERQKILDANGHVLVIGGPGSGKTTIALLKSLRFIEQRLLPGQKVLFLSFSRAAVARIAQSSENLIPPGKKSLLSVQTFHSFSWEVIKSHGYLTGIPKKLKILLPHEEESERAGRDQDSADWTSEKERLLTQNGRITFDRFAPILLKLFSTSKRIRSIYSSRYPLVIVDEAQDTGDDQWSCVQLLSSNSQVVALADLDQQIYDFRKDVSPERMKQIVDSLSPLQIDLGAQNNRSPSSEVVKFGNDLLIGQPKADAYKAVFNLGFSPRATNRDTAIRQSIGILNRKISAAKGSAPENIAMLASWGKGVQTISRALKGSDSDNEIPHQILFDETQVLLASRLVALTLEPIDPRKIHHHVADACDLIAAIFQAKGKSKGVAEATKFKQWSDELKRGASPKRAKSVSCLLKIFTDFSEKRLSGSPHKDWLSVKSAYFASGTSQLKSVVSDVELIMTFKRGKIISARLSDQWKKTRSYLGARRILEDALSEDQLISGNTDLKGISVMTIHKSKGKEFDGVIVFYDSNISPLIARGDSTPFVRSRKLLRVAATRAKISTLLLTDASTPCPLLQGFQYEQL